MAVNLNELLALPREERMKIAETLLESAVPPDMEGLLVDFVTRMERTNQALKVAIDRLDSLDERIERDRAEVRDAVLRSGETWPFLLSQ